MDRSPMEEFLDHMNPATEMDRKLIELAATTPGWEEPPGERPAFIFTGAVRGPTGKTSTAQLIGELWGGFFLLDSFDWEEPLAYHLADKSTAGYRCILFDDVHIHDFSYPKLESLLTAEEIRVGGRESKESVPNMFTVFMTTSEPEVCIAAGDLAIIIRLGPQTSGGH